MASMRERVFRVSDIQLQPRSSRRSRRRTRNSRKHETSKLTKSRKRVSTAEHAEAFGGLPAEQAGRQPDSERDVNRVTILCASFASFASLAFDACGSSSGLL